MTVFFERWGGRPWVPFHKILEATLALLTKTIIDRKTRTYIFASLEGFYPHLSAISINTGDSLLVRVLDLWPKGCKFESQQEWQENFLLRRQHCVLTLTRCPFHPCVTTVACKRPRSFCQKCKWQVTPKRAYTFDPTKLEWADYAAVQA